jgi:hypothetical protein
MSEANSTDTNCPSSAPTSRLTRRKSSSARAYRELDGNLRSDLDHPPARNLKIVGRIVASAAERDEKMILPAGIPECAAGLSARRDRKNDVDMMSNCHPSFRAIASAFGTLGDSIIQTASLLWRRSR